MSSQKTTKKRGRKPSKKVIKDITFVKNPENSILHLPLTQENINSVLKNTNMVQPLPYEPNLLFKEIKENEIKTDKKESYIIIQESTDTNPNDDEVNDVDNKYIKKNLKDVLYEFLDGNSRNKWPIAVNIRCMWCCHKFKNIPIAIPEKYINKKFYVNGNFCSFNCAASYIFNSNMVPSDKWEKYSLLNLLRKKLTNKTEKIALAPPRETLTEFGGFYSIDEFRQVTSDKTYNIINPPMISIVPKIEENTYNYKLRDTDSFIPLNKELLKKAGDSLKIRREKKRTNTLQKYMNLQIA